MKTRRVFVLEDHEPQRLALQLMLRRRGFQVDSAGDIQTARSMIQPGIEFDVAILDMRIEDRAVSHITGADIGIELLRSQSDRPPEFIIHSAYPGADYYRQALKLQAAVYLNKGEDLDGKNLMLHVRVLALRRALNAMQLATEKHTQEIVRKSLSPAEAMQRYCQEILDIELSDTLGCQYVMLLTTNMETGGDITIPCGGNIVLPQEPLGVYQYIQDLISFPRNTSVPLIIIPEKLRLAEAPEYNDVLDILRDAAFVPLARTRTIRLSLGIIQPDDKKSPSADNAEALARIILALFQEPVLDHLFTLMTMWTEIETRKRALLVAVSKFYSRMGQEAASIFGELMQDTDAAKKSDTRIDNLQGFIDSLRNVKEVLVARPDAGDFDVLIVHNKEDEQQVSVIVSCLRERRINPWIAAERIRPGQITLAAIEQAISEAKAAAIIVGSKGIDKWQTWEMRTLVRRCVESEISVIPILLPGVNDFPADISLFLKELHSVRFAQDLTDTETLDLLEWGIRGLRP